MKQKEQPIPIKILVLGDYGVGKTTLINSYIDGKISYPPISDDFRSKEISIAQNDVILQFWDPAGQQQFKNIGRFFYRNVNACIFVYDLTNPQSLENIAFWMEQVKNNSQVDKLSKVPKVLVGNKSDLLFKRQVKIEHVQQIKELYPQLSCFQVSSITSEGIDEFLQFLYDSPDFIPAKPDKKQKQKPLEFRKIKPKAQRKYEEYKKCC